MAENLQTFKINGELEITRLGYGGMQLTGDGVWGEVADQDNALKLLRHAVEAGVNFIDTADSYGPHTNERLIADALHPYPSGLTIATKGGFERTGPNQWVVNGHPAHIKAAIEGSLQRLKVDRIDLWQLHRVDSRIPVAETLGPVADAVKAGKIRFVGLSEVDIPQIEEAEKTIPIVSVQNLYNLGNRRWEAVVDYTERRNMAFIPWYPLASGPAKLATRVKDAAAKYKTTIPAIALAWLLKRAPNMILIPGTRSIGHLQENLDAARVSLSDEDFKLLS